MVCYMCVLCRLAKRSWFGGLMGMEQEHHFVMVREKSFSQVKADVVHAFLSVNLYIVCTSIYVQGLLLHLECSP